ncbi:MAG: cupin domain-containing protein [Phycisphaeraceae bacterium]
MTRLLIATVALLGLVGCQGTTAMEDPGPDRHLLYQAREIPWQDGPASLPAGAEFAVLEGDPGEPGLFTMQIKVPDGYVIPPHWHPNVERVTVLDGTFHLGHGGEVDPDATERLDMGSYTAMPPGMRHFAIAEGETVIQLTSIGPWVIHYINPADDPRQ